MFNYNGAAVPHLHWGHIFECVCVFISLTLSLSLSLYLSLFRALFAESKNSVSTAIRLRGTETGMILWFNLYASTVRIAM